MIHNIKAMHREKFILDSLEFGHTFNRVINQTLEFQ